MGIKKNPKNLAFSLFEVSLVIIIISALIGVVVAGNKMSRSLKVDSIMNDATDIRESFAKFEQLYDYPAGDLPDNNLIPYNDPLYADIQGGSGPYYPDPGNGNNLPDDVDNALNQLTAAGLLKNSIFEKAPSTFSPNNKYYLAGKRAFGNLYPSQITNAGYYLEYIEPGMLGPDEIKGVVIRLVTIVDDETLAGTLTPEEVKNMDEKYDDGDPFKGAIVVDSSLDSACLNASSELDLNVKYPACGLRIALEEKLIDKAQIIATGSICPAGGKLGDKRVSSSQVCPIGYDGDVFETCTSDTTWHITEDNCIARTCQGRPIGDVQKGQCGPGFSTGFTVSTCTTEGVGTIDTSSCGIDRSKCRQDSYRYVACPDLSIGYIRHLCSSFQNWQPSLANCTKTCTLGATRTGPTCSSQTGGIMVNGTSGSEPDTTEVCTVHQSYHLTKDNCVIPNNFAGCSEGATRTVPCRPSYYGVGGQIDQTCNADGYWVTTSNKCKLKKCGDSYIGATKTSNYKCQVKPGVLHNNWGVMLEYCADRGANLPPSWNLYGGNCMENIP